jgi:hypothetical protein
MRIAIVKASTLAKHRRWDAGYYLGNREILDGERIKAAERNLKAAQTRLANAIAERDEERARIERLKVDG